MKLCSIKLHNFRQFYGKQQIDFSTDTQNITVILGENGNGKTGIFRAIIFCLFNEHELPKDKLDRGTNTSKVHLVNLNFLQENKEIPMEAKVELIFENLGKKYFLERSSFDIMSSDGIIKSNLEVYVKLTVQLENGNCEPVIETNSEVSRIINGIIDNSIKDLFFFDGDKIEALSTTNASSREEIKNGIMRLLHIDSIKRAIEIVNRLKADQLRSVKGKADTKLQAGEDELDKLKVLVQDNQNRLDLKRCELEKVQTQIVNYEREQQENAPIKKLFEQRSSVIDNKKKTENILDKLRNEINMNLSQKGHSILMQESLLYTNSFIVKEEKDKSIHSGVTSDLIEEILSTKQCLCGSTFENGDDVYLRLFDLKEKYSKMKLSSFIIDFKRNIRTSLEFGDSFDLYMQKCLKDYFDLNDELESLRKSLDDIDRKKGEYSQKEERLNGLEIGLQNCKKDANEIKEAIAVLEYDLRNRTQMIASQETYVKELRKKDQELQHDNRMLEYYEGLYDLFVSIRDSYSTKMRARLSEESTDIFEKLISEKDKRILSQIIINDQYEIQAKGWNDISMFQDISSGQKQMLSLSFVASLARVAAGGSKNLINMPLFMDTPFAKLDGNNRDSLITTMPELTSQWILLVTDSEFARREVECMKKTQRWGKFYRLEKVEHGYTKIVIIEDINEYVSNR